jgi:quinol monooxygenase YgiN
MITRLVKMAFQVENIPDFLELFDRKKHAIKSSEGCLSLQLLLHAKNDGIIFTISVWKDEASLERYRKSDLFKNTWQATKIYFADRPEAWTTSEY